jgi:hypothetical protein
MKKVKTYWDEIKHEESFYYGGTQGWEIHLRWKETLTWNPKTHEYKEGKSLQFDFPFRAGDGVPGAEKSLVRKEVTFKRKREKLLAQASRDRAEFDDLYSRVSRVSAEEWNEIIESGLKGFDLGTYIRSKHYTEREAYALFWNM